MLESIFRNKNNFSYQLSCSLGCLLLVLQIGLNASADLTQYNKINQKLKSWDLNDVSILYPLPTAEQLGKDDSFIYFTSTSNPRTKFSSFVLPQDLLQHIPALIIPHSLEEIQASLQVVAIRIDPCFLEGDTVPYRCQKQVRFVWQPIEVGRRQQVVALDAALHSFYLLTDQQFSFLLLNLQKLKSEYLYNSNGQPLFIHSGLTRNLSYRKSLSNLFLSVANTNNLIRVTSMGLRGAGDMWTFQSFAYHNDQLTAEVIPRIQFATMQTFMNSAIPATSFDGGSLDPMPEGTDTFNELMLGSIELPENKILMQKQMQSILNIENPLKHNPKTIDCVSCHVAGPAKIWSLSSGLDWLDFVKNNSYQNSNYNLTNPTEFYINTQRLRAFGYSDSLPIISQRVINESAVVATYLNSL